MLFTGCGQEGLSIAYWGRDDRDLGFGIWDLAEPVRGPLCALHSQPSSRLLGRSLLLALMIIRQQVGKKTVHQTGLFQLNVVHRWWIGGKGVGSWRLGERRALAT